MPEGTYNLQAKGDGRCIRDQTVEVTIAGDTVQDFTLPRLTDVFGYHCRVQPIDYVEAANDTGMYGDDTATQVNLPFPFTLYGKTYDQASVSTNGYLNFLTGPTNIHGGPNTRPLGAQRRDLRLLGRSLRRLRQRQCSHGTAGRRAEPPLRD